ncbi:MAG: phosphotransferase [Pseudomonadales bacterium]|nr:phosphotransferase [Pseudomonadales bacterium]
MQQDDRAQGLRAWAEAWIATHHQEWGSVMSMLVVSGDASFRRYFRLLLPHGSLIAVDASPVHENNPAFVAIASALRAHGLQAPEVIAWNAEQGYLLLNDLGDRLLLPALKPDTVDELYKQAMQILLRMQDCEFVPGWILPAYDRVRLMDEMKLFHDWFLSRYLGLALSVTQHAILSNALELILEQVMELPTCFVHRDFHSRNLMLLQDQELGVLDFQDAVLGPFNYDLISLLRDAYVVWPRPQVMQWMLHFFRMARKQGRLEETMNESAFLESCEWMSAQRHLKVLGIFARLCLRDGKAGYLKDIPLVLAYLLDEISHLPALRPLHQFLEQTVYPAYLDREPQGRVELP